MKAEASENSTPMNEGSFDAFDTCNTIRVAASDQLIDQMVKECLWMQKAFNRFSDSSEVARINHSAGEWVECSHALSTMVQVSKALFEETDGAYNIALGPVLALWNFNETELIIPSQDLLKRTLRYCDLSQVKIENDRILVPAHMELDFGSIAKGFAADIVASTLVENGCRQGFLNFGGTILVLGPKENDEPWSFGLQEPYRPHGQQFWAVLECRKGAFATSGSYARGVTMQGHRYHHIIDPRDGMPVSNGVLEVTVFAGSAMMADTLSTSLFVLGLEKGLKLADDLEVGALFRLEDGRAIMTKGFPVKLVSDSSWHGPAGMVE